MEEDNKPEVKESQFERNFKRKQERLRKAEAAKEQIPDRMKKVRALKTKRWVKDRKAAEDTLQVAQGTLMAVHRMLGKNLAEIARAFEVSTETVKSRLTLAREQDILKITQDLIKTRLLPKAIAVYENHLDENSLEAARDVMRGTGSLQQNATLNIAGPAESVDSFRRAYFEKQPEPIDVTPASEK